jgi:2-C-methyl-D-erythritol 2,4-cyclodiphosphate synthase
MRIGNGFDVHALVAGRRLVLGGVVIPYDRGLDGHSDADVLLHAVCDAILGALALGDIGAHFPDSDARWKDADSRVLLRHVVSLATGRGYRIGNLDVTLIAQAPKVAPYVAAMRANLAADLGCEEGEVSVKATTSERLGFTGRGEGIAAMATVLLRGGTEFSNPMRRYSFAAFVVALAVRGRAPLWRRKIFPSRAIKLVIPAAAGWP